MEEVSGRLEGLRSVVGQDGHVLEILVQALRPERKLTAADPPRERAHVDLVGEDVDVAVELAPECLVRQPRSQARLVRRDLGGIGGGRHPDVEDDPARLRHARVAVVEASHELEHLGSRARGARENLGRELVERPGFALLDVEAALRHSLPGEYSRLVEGPAGIQSGWPPTTQARQAFPLDVDVHLISATGWICGLSALSSSNRARNASIVLSVTSGGAVT